MEYRAFTAKEKKWLAEFKNIMKRAPKSLLLFVGGPGVVIHTKDKNNRRYSKSSGSLDPWAPSETIETPMDTEGGDY